MMVRIIQFLDLILMLDKSDIKSMELFHFLIVYEFKFKFNIVFASPNINSGKFFIN